MYQVYLVGINGGVDFGQPVESLDHAVVVVKMLDWLFETNQLPISVAFYNTDIEVFARHPDGLIVSYHDQDPSGASDGIWDKV